MKMTLQYSLILSPLLIFTAALVAEERGQSIMFGDTPGYRTKAPIESINQADDECRRLADEIERLKGKPQRRYTAKQRYDAECRQRIQNE
ncbi:MAG: hypothetical protein QNJ78_06845 [Gammaproteobacteria bacterium]|nr:hypothetical protein [Gammaproteobacteria bacterium]